MIKKYVLPVDSQDAGNTVGRIEDVPKRAVSEVLASTSQVTSGSGLSREKVELAFKLLEVSSRILRVLYLRSSSTLISLFAGGIGTGG